MTMAQMDLKSGRQQILNCSFKKLPLGGDKILSHEDNEEFLVLEINFSEKMSVAAVLFWDHSGYSI